MKTDLTTKYLGLNLRNPIIIGSSSLTESVENIKELEKNGAGAVILKSLFEEQIMLDAESSIKEAYASNLLYSQKSESLDYIDMHIRKEALTDYVELIKKAKREVVIPVIASINCVTASEWTTFAKSIEEAGADALEVNISILPSDTTMSSEKREKIFFDIIEKVKKEVSIPLAIKISPYFSNLAQMVSKISETGINGVVMFNRFYSPDFDINNFKEKSANTFSSPQEFNNVLRWVAIISGKTECDIAASTGIHDGQAVIKQILAGAKATQIVSTLYKNGVGQIQNMLKDIENWMDVKGYNYISQFRGKMSQKEIDNPASFERVQFMKYFSGIGKE